MIEKYPSNFSLIQVFYIYLPVALHNYTKMKFLSQMNCDCPGKSKVLQT